ncbi:hypothetical protein DFJ77DRAFT_468073 [Powellomyces hirtus]|nr:hypothetical protein DFJ77DRAFT_468073 [Powellomyces hirtus]
MAPIPNNRPVDHFSAIPQELSVHIVKYLEASQVAKLAQTSRHFAAACKDDFVWNLLTRRRFGKDILQSEHEAANGADVDHYALFRRHLEENGLRMPASRLSIIWMNNQWWRWSTHPTAHSAKVAHLNLVHWFDVRATIRGVPRGKYTPTWRFRFLRNSHGLDNVVLGARVILPPTTEEMERNEHPDTNVTLKLGDALNGLRSPALMGFFTVNVLPDEWIEVQLPTLNVGEWPSAGPYHNVEFDAVDHSTGAKQGLLIDCFTLVPVNHHAQRDEQAALEQNGEFGVTTPGAYPQELQQQPSDSASADQQPERPQELPAAIGLQANQRIGAGSIGSVFRRFPLW